MFLLPITTLWQGEWEVNFGRRTHTWEAAKLCYRGDVYRRNEKHWLINVAAVEAAFAILPKDEETLPCRVAGKSVEQDVQGGAQVPVVTEGSRSSDLEALHGWFHIISNGSSAFMPISPASCMMLPAAVNATEVARWFLTTYADRWCQRGGLHPVFSLGGAV